MSIEQNKELVRNFFAAMGRGDRQALAAMLAEDARWVIPQAAPAHAGTHIGREHILDIMLGSIPKIFVPGTNRLDIHALIAEGDYVAAPARVTATTPQGRQYDNQYVFIFRMAGGVIAEFHEHLDTRYAAAFFVFD
jgi:ketosteroid isomerase-like protein